MDQRQAELIACHRECEHYQARALGALAEGVKAQANCVEETHLPQRFQIRRSEAHTAALSQTQEVMHLRTQLAKLQEELTEQGHRAVVLAERREHTALLYERATAGTAHSVQVLGQALPTLLTQPHAFNGDLAHIKALGQLANSPLALTEIAPAVPPELRDRALPMEKVVTATHAPQAGESPPPALGTQATARSAPTSPARDYSSPSPGVKRSRSEDGSKPRAAAKAVSAHVLGLTYPLAVEHSPRPAQKRAAEGEESPHPAKGKLGKGPLPTFSRVPKEGLANHIWLSERHRSSPTKKKGWADWAYKLRHRAKEEVCIITDPAMARSEIYTLVDLIRPVRRGLAFPDGIPAAYEDMFFEEWMACPFFLEMAARWAIPHRREDLWSALSVVQFPPQWSTNKVEKHSSIATYPLIQVLWYTVQKQDLYFVRMHPGLALDAYWLAPSTADSSRGKQEHTKKK